MEKSNDTRVVDVSTAHGVSSLQDPELSDSNGIAIDQNDSAQAIGIGPPALGASPTTDFTTTQTPNANDSGNSVLSTGDLVKVFEIALAEIRSSQTLAFSVLGFCVACGAFIQKIHENKVSTDHKSIYIILWAIGVGISTIGAGLIGYTSSHYSPLQDFIRAAEPGKSELVLENLRGALNKANISARRFHRFRAPILIGVLFVVFAVVCEVYNHTSK